MSILSALHRHEILNQLQSETYGLVVIGGGITGAGIALDAASRGMKVALVEKGDFASGTSSKSTKLIHGGLRYLKQFEIGLVREVGRERAIVHRLAPHLVHAEKMLLPLIKGGTFGPFSTSFGLWVYDILAGVRGKDKRKMLSKAKTLEKEPFLSGQADILQGGGYYAEYRTDDARLAIENIKTAAQYGALPINHVQVEEMIYENGRVAGVKCLDTIGGTQLNIRSSYVVSAAGPWVDTLRKSDHSLKGKHLFLSKGVHIVVPHERFPIRQSLYFDVPDGRMAFAIPRHRATYIGTTDTPYKGSLDDIPIDREDVDYLLNATNHMFPQAKLSIDDVESSWAGLRPLIHEEGKSASEMSRKDEIFESESGLLSIAGGKLTGYRKMAERVVKRVTQKFKEEHGQSFKENHTDKIPLTGGPFKNAREVKDYQQMLADRLSNTSLNSFYASYLVSNYGKQSDIILAKMKEYGNEEDETALIRAEVWFSIHHELAAKPMDFLNRRSGRLYFNLPSVEKAFDIVMKDFQNYFNWDAAQLADEKAAARKAIEWVTHFEYAAKENQAVS